MSVFVDVFHRNLIFIALIELSSTAYAEDFAVTFSINTDISNDLLALSGVKGVLKKQENAIGAFDLKIYGTGEVVYTLHPTSTDIVHMYGDIMILRQHLGEAEDDDSVLHCKFVDDNTCREFQRQFNPTSLQNGEVEACLVQLRLVDEKQRTRDRIFPTRAVTVSSVYIDSLEMKVFMIVDGSFGQDSPQQAYLIVPESGFRITEPCGREVMLFSSTRTSWKYILHFKNAHEATLFVGKMSAYAENQTIVLFNSKADWINAGYFRRLAYAKTNSK